MKKKKLPWLIVGLAVLFCIVILWMIKTGNKHQLGTARLFGSIGGTAAGSNEDRFAKEPSEYSWQEYQQLTLEEQEQFFATFDSVKSFEEWMESVKPVESTPPDVNWDESGKLPIEYTWEEHQSLSREEKDSFFAWFGSEESYEEWMASVKPAESTSSDIDWEKTGKLPNEYSWEEYAALEPKEKDSFFEWFGSVESFEVWMQKVKPEESPSVDINWDESGKAPIAYTWDEYETLSPEEKDSFFGWFDSEESFEKWMESVKPTESASSVINWDELGKLPNEFAWEEYEALSPEAQDAFFEWFESVEKFEAWIAEARE